jgi:hypothetical protein
MRTLSVASTAWVSPDRVGIQARLCWASSSPVTTAHHPVEGLGGRGVDRVDAGVGHRAAQDRHVQHAWAG